MGFTLEDKMGITWEQIKMLAEIMDKTGLDITKMDSISDIFVEYYKTIPFEMLHDLYEGEAVELCQNTKTMLKTEMQRRIDKPIDKSH